ncbi:MAG: sigma-70 family RNA polymerase sigma factor [Gemmatimonadota bacterium]
MSEADVDGWARRARDGDDAAFETLVRHLVRPALAAAWEFVQTREDAEDVVQDAFTRAYQRLQRYDPSRPFAPWFFTIVRNAARNASSWDARWDRTPLMDDQLATQESDPLDRIDVDHRLQQALELLSPMQRACFRLTELEGFGRAEVAEMLGVSAATVRVHIHRARAALQTQMVDLRRRVPR